MKGEEARHRESMLAEVNGEELEDEGEEEPAAVLEDVKQVIININIYMKGE